MHAPLDVVLFEGWMLGFTAVTDDDDITASRHAGTVEKEKEMYGSLSSVAW